MVCVSSGRGQDLRLSRESSDGENLSVSERVFLLNGESEERRDMKMIAAS